MLESSLPLEDVRMVTGAASDSIGAPSPGKITPFPNPHHDESSPAVRCESCGGTLRVSPGLNEFTCISCGWTRPTPQKGRRFPVEPLQLTERQKIAADEALACFLQAELTDLNAKLDDPSALLPVFEMVSKAGRLFRLLLIATAIPAMIWLLIQPHRAGMMLVTAGGLIVLSADIASRAQRKRQERLFAARLNAEILPSLRQRRDKVLAALIRVWDRLGRFSDQSP